LALRVRLRLDHDQHGGTARSSTPEWEQNSKLEIRNPKQTRRLKKGELEKRRAMMAGDFPLFEFQICFGFRASDFGFPFPAARKRPQLDRSSRPKKQNAPRPEKAHGAKN